MKGETSGKWSGRTGGGNVGLGILISTLASMPLWCAYLLLEIGLPFHLLFHPGYFRATKHFFRYRMRCGKCSAWMSAYATHRQFGRMMFDRFRFFSNGGKDFSVKNDGDDMIRRLAASCGGLVICGSHVGSMEMAGYMLGLEEIPISAIVYGGENPYLQKRRGSALGNGGIKMIPASDDLSHLFAAKMALDRGECVSMTCDRISGSSKSIEVEFMGKRAGFPIGAFALAATLEKEVVLLFCMKEGKREYNVITRHLDIDRTGKSRDEVIRELLHLYVAALEEIVRRYPTQWFNFYEFWDD